ncbi:MAG: EamA family transporter [Anaerolineales bacterium]|jgi:drug/metabolite transporter (DMT)-like permease
MKIKIWLPLLLVYVIWGSTYLAIHYAVSTIPPFLMAGTRFLVAGTILYAWRRLAGDPAPTKRQWFSSAVIGLLLLFGGNGLLSLAEQMVPSGVAALMIGSVPLWMAVIEAVRPGGARPNLLGAVGLLIGFGGIVLLVGPSLWGGARAEFNPLGIGILLAAALFWSFGSIYSRSADLPGSSLLATGMEMLAGGLGLYLAASLKGEWHLLVLTQVAASSWLGLAYLIVFGSMVGFTAYAWLLRNAPLPLVSTYAYVNPLVAILLGGLFAHELLNARILLAALIILSSVVVINISRQVKLPARSAATAK